MELHFWCKQGKPTVESADGGMTEAGMTALRFRGKIREGEVQNGRYFLVASYGDPWAQRALIVHGLAGLKDSVGIVSTDGFWPITKGLPAIATRGWKLSTRKQGLVKGCSQATSKKVVSVCLFVLVSQLVTSKPLYNTP
jgi:glutathionyl-hydroquinone reductase